MTLDDFNDPPKKRKKLSEIVAPRAKRLSDKIEQLDEGRRYINVNNRERIGIDQPHHPGQQEHAHLENGRAVNKDGSLSHGGKPFTLTRDQAAAFKGADFKIGKSRLVESEGGKITMELEPAVVEFLIKLQVHLTVSDDD